jgi:hypothetical protein
MSGSPLFVVIGGKHVAVPEEASELVFAGAFASAGGVGGGVGGVDFGAEGAVVAQRLKDEHRVAKSAARRELRRRKSAASKAEKAAENAVKGVLGLEAAAAARRKAARRKEKRRRDALLKVSGGAGAASGGGATGGGGSSGGGSSAVSGGHGAVGISRGSFSGVASTTTNSGVAHSSAGVATRGDPQPCPGGCPGTFCVRGYGNTSLAKHAFICSGPRGDALRECIRSPLEFSSMHEVLLHLGSSAMSSYRLLDGSAESARAWRPPHDGLLRPLQILSLGCMSQTRRASAEVQALPGQLFNAQRDAARLHAAQLSRHQSSQLRKETGQTAFKQNSQHCFARCRVSAIPVPPLHVVPASASASAPFPTSAPPLLHSAQHQFPGVVFRLDEFACHHAECSVALTSMPTKAHGAEVEVRYCLVQGGGNTEAALVIHNERSSAIRAGTYGLGSPIRRCVLCPATPLTFESSAMLEEGGPVLPSLSGSVSLATCSGHLCALKGHTYCLSCFSKAHFLLSGHTHKPVFPWEKIGAPPWPLTIPLSPAKFENHVKGIKEDGARGDMASTFYQLTLLRLLTTHPEMSDMHIAGKCALCVPAYILHIFCHVI